MSSAHCHTARHHRSGPYGHPLGGHCFLGNPAGERRGGGAPDKGGVAGRPQSHAVLGLCRPVADFLDESALHGLKQIHQQVSVRVLSPVHPPSPGRRMGLMPRKHPAEAQPWGPIHREHLLPTPHPPVSP